MILRSPAAGFCWGVLSAAVCVLLAFPGVADAQTNTACPTLNLATVQCKNGVSLCLYQYTNCEDPSLSWTCWAVCTDGISKCENGACAVDTGTPPTSNLGVPNQVSVYVNGSTEQKYYRANRSIDTTTVRLVDTSPTNWGQNNHVVTFVKNVKMTFNNGTQGYAALYTVAPQSDPDDAFHFGIRLDAEPSSYTNVASQKLVVQFPTLSQQEFQGIDTVNGHSTSYHVVGGY